MIESGREWLEVLRSFRGGAIFAPWREGEADRIALAARNVSRFPIIVQMARVGRGPEAFYELGSELLIDLGGGASLMQSALTGSPTSSHPWTCPARMDRS